MTVEHSERCAKLFQMQAMRLAQAVRDDVVGAQRDALLADLRKSTADGQHVLARNCPKHPKNLAL